MRRLIPSPALAVAVVALIVALAGTAVAEPVAELARKISGSNLKSRSVSRTKIKKNTLTGTEIRESKLRRVPRAEVADNAFATAGVTMRRVFFKAAPGTAPAVILDLNGLRVTGACNAAGNPVVTATTTVNGAIIRRHVAQGGNNENAGGSNSFNINSSFDAIGGLQSGNGRLTYARTTGQVVTLVGQWDDAPTYGTENVCTYVGIAQAG